MKRCPQCNRLYSDVTEKCPQCGISLLGGSGSNTGANSPQQAQGSYQQLQKEYSSGGYQQQNTYQQPQNSNQQSSINNQQGTSFVSTASDEKMGFGEALRICFNKYACFSGRASRAEYWWFWLFTASSMCVDYVIFNPANSILGCFITLILLIVIGIPSLAVGWRRLHDIGKSGALMLVPIYNLVLLLQEGEPYDNQYGSVPAK